MITDTLTKLTRKKKMWITPNHPLYFESYDFKVLYSAAIFLFAKLNKTINPLNNFELERLFIKGFSFNPKDISNVIKTANESIKDIDTKINSILDTPNKKYLFIMDLFNISNRNEELTTQENEFISIFCSILSIQEDEKVILNNFIKAAHKIDKVKCIEIYETMLYIKIPFSISELKYYIPDIEYITLITNNDIIQTSQINLIDNCEIKEDIIIGKDKNLVIINAVVVMKGMIIVDGGSVTIINSHIINKIPNNKTLIDIRYYSKVNISNTVFDCMNTGGVINQNNGILTIKDSKIYNTTRMSAIRFWGELVNIKNCKFNNCFSTKDGGALNIKNGKVFIENTVFKNCEAKSGGAVFTTSNTNVKDCNFILCKAINFGSAIYYNGEKKGDVINCTYTNCYPNNLYVVQYLGKTDELRIDKEYEINVSTILEQELIIDKSATLNINDAYIYVNKPIKCKGKLNINNSVIKAHNIQSRDMIIMEMSSNCNFYNTEFDGRLMSGIMKANETKVYIKNCLFRNTIRGRAIYCTYEINIENTIFSYCLDGAIYTRYGNVNESIFINCRGKSGAGIITYGNKGKIENSKFIRCISEYSGGAIDLLSGIKVSNCDYEECKPNNIS